MSLASGGFPPGRACWWVPARMTTLGPARAIGLRCGRRYTNPPAIRSVDAIGQTAAARRTVSAHVLVLVLFGAEGWVSRSRQRVSVYWNGVVEAMKAWMVGRSRSGAVSWR